MKTRNYQVTLTGASDLLMHRDNIEFGGKIRAWQKDPGNKGASVAGDDRSPAWTWLSYLYTELPKGRGRVCIDSDNIMTMLRDGGKKCPAPVGRGSMKSQTQSGIMCNEIGWPIIVSGREIQASALFELLNESDFEKHEEAAEKHGFTLFCKRARVGTSKHVRVRPRFAGWSATGTLTVSDDSISKQMLETILLFAGNYSGLCDWRPSSPKAPGPFGRFIPTVTEL